MLQQYWKSVSLEVCTVHIVVTLTSELAAIEMLYSHTI